MLKVPDVQILEVELKKTKQWVIIFRSFAILPYYTTIIRAVYKDITFVVYRKAYTRSYSAGVYKQIRLVQCMNPFPAVSEVLQMLNNKFSL